MTKYRIDVYIIDDHTMFNEGLVEAINQSDTVHVSRTFTTLGECRSVLDERRPDVLLLDVSVPDGNSAVFCQWLTTTYPKVRIVAVTIHDEYSVIRQMLDCGVHGYILKSSPIEELLEAVVTVWQGNSYLSHTVEEIIRRGCTKEVTLTPAEQKVLRQLCAGHTNREIAKQLNLSIETVNWYRKRLLAKYDVRNVVQLVNLVMKEKLL
jgi:DNA-binding NarL/FixJ family response regulator